MKGFTLIELVVAVFIFGFLCLSVYGLYTAIIKGITSLRERATISFLADKYIETARNLPYSKVGTISGNPHGELPDEPNLDEIDFNGLKYLVYYVVNYVDDPADGTAVLGSDPAPSDYKQVKLYIKNKNTLATNTFLTSIAPKGLESMESGGALAIKVFDALGQPLPGSSIQIKNTSLDPNIDLTRITDDSGNWVEVGLPESANSYQITAFKSGYSNDKTYPSTEQNPNPIKPYATVLAGQVTQVSFSIDRLANLAINVLDQSCSALPGINLEISGEKIIGTPDVLKFKNNYTSGAAGSITLENIEWDNYAAEIKNQDYMVYGFWPAPKIGVLAGASRSASFILGPSTENSLLVSVKDAETGSAIEGATVALQRNLFNEVKTTGENQQECYPLGQVFYAGLDAAQDYRLEVSMAGYESQLYENTNISGHKFLEILLSR